MRGRRRPTRDRVVALGIAAVDGAEEAARQTGIPPTTIRQWMESPEFVELRTRTKDAVAAEWWAIVQKAFRRASDLIDGTDDLQKVATAGAIMFDKLALSRGEVTSRTETRTWSDSLDDDEKRKLRDWIDGLDDSATPDRQGAPAGATEDAGTEVR